MSAVHHEIDNLTVIVDRNGIQNDDFCESQMRMFDVSEKFASFGWAVMEIEQPRKQKIFIQKMARKKFVKSRKQSPAKSRPDVLSPGAYNL